jgi:peptide/nickel transport system permease protein
MQKAARMVKPSVGRVEKSDVLGPQRRSELEKTLYRFSRNVSGMVGLILVLIVGVSALAAPLLTQADPNDTDVRNVYAPPSLDHPLGTDHLGRDLFCRVLYGARVSVVIGLVVVTITTATGSTIGFLTGYFPRLDAPLMRFVDMLNAIPAILLALAIVAILGPQLINIAIAVSIVLTVGAARVVRSVVLQLRETEFIEAARAIGAGDLRIILRHLLPNTLPPLIVQQSFTLAVAILTEASLTFLGVGGPVETPTLGMLISESRNYLQAHPTLSVYPGATIFLFVLGANLLGDGLRDVLDPRMRR